MLRRMADGGRVAGHVPDNRKMLFSKERWLDGGQSMNGGIHVPFPSECSCTTQGNIVYQAGDLSLFFGRFPHRWTQARLWRLAARWLGIVHFLFPDDWCCITQGFGAGWRSSMSYFRRRACSLPFLRHRETQFIWQLGLTLVSVVSDSLDRGKTLVGGGWRMFGKQQRQGVGIRRGNISQTLRTDHGFLCPVTSTSLDGGEAFVDGDMAKGRGRCMGFSFAKETRQCICHCSVCSLLDVRRK